MRVRLLAFATAAEALGGRETELELPPESTVGALRTALLARAPALAPLGARLAIAVDGALADDAVMVPAGAEVALLPPVSGG
jgi:molybdopterin converting factor small subunit